MTTVFVTHDQTEAIALADRIAVMEQGVLQQYAPPAALKEQPANLFVASFIGEPPMNIVDARLATAATAAASWRRPRRAGRVPGPAGRLAGGAAGAGPTAASSWASGRTGSWSATRRACRPP